MTRLFIPGLKLARDFYAEVVRPLLDEQFPDLPYSAALLGPGSEVLGFDTLRSTDHNWGPRLQLFLPADDAAGHGDELTEMLAARLPARFRGFPTSFAHTQEPDRPPRHRLEVAELGGWLKSWLGFDPRRAVTTLDWLATPTQRLAEVTGGDVFHDGLATLIQARDRLRWYPRDVWFYVLACQWQRIGQEEPFVGRCGELDDHVGSAVVAARLVRDLMRLCLLMERRYPPYSKWLGTAFSHLPTATTLKPVLARALAATHWRYREQHLCDAYQAIARLHNQLGLTAAVDPHVHTFHDRPYRVLGAERFTAALLERITDPVLRRLPLSGAVDQFMDSIDALGNLGLLRATIAAKLNLTDNHSDR
jgi:hypothetical protein